MNIKDLKILILYIVRVNKLLEIKIKYISVSGRMKRSVRMIQEYL